MVYEKLDIIKTKCIYFYSYIINISLLIDIRRYVISSRYFPFNYKMLHWFRLEYGNRLLFEFVPPPSVFVYLSSVYRKS